MCSEWLAVGQASTTHSWEERGAAREAPGAWHMPCVFPAASEAGPEASPAAAAAERRGRALSSLPPGAQGVESGGNMETLALRGTHEGGAVDGGGEPAWRGSPDSRRRRCWAGGESGTVSGTGMQEAVPQGSAPRACSGGRPASRPSARFSGSTTKVSRLPGPLAPASCPPGPQPRYPRPCSCPPTSRTAQARVAASASCGQPPGQVPPHCCPASGFLSWPGVCRAGTVSQRLPQLPHDIGEAVGSLTERIPSTLCPPPSFPWSRSRSASDGAGPAQPCAQPHSTPIPGGPSHTAVTSVMPQPQPGALKQRNGLQHPHFWRTELSPRRAAPASGSCPQRLRAALPQSPTGGRSPSPVRAQTCRSCPGKPVNFDDYGDAHIPAAVLKTFLRELPQPLLTFPAYEQVLGITSTCRPRSSPTGTPSLSRAHVRGGQGWLSCRVAEGELTVGAPCPGPVTVGGSLLWPGRALSEGAAVRAGGAPAPGPTGAIVPRKTG